MKKEEIFKEYEEHILPTYRKIPLVFVKGKGSRLWDLHNKVFLDFFPGWGVNNLGHCHPKVMSAVRDQSARLIFVPNSFYNLCQAQLARELSFYTFPASYFFCNSGAEANEAAIKFVRQFGAGRHEIITFENAFHGRTMGALAATGQEKYQRGFGPMLAGFKSVPFNDIGAVENAVGPNTAAVMLELIQGEGGINVANKEFVVSLREICDRRKLLLIVDEVQTGIGRTGKMFCYQNYGVVPDILTLAKALGGGFPIGLMAVKKELSGVLGPGMHASTFGGGPVICKAALAVLRAVRREKLLENAVSMGEYLKARLTVLKDKYPVIKEVRGMGLMLGIELSVPGDAVVASCRENGLLINCTHENVLRVMPALNVTRGQVGKAAGILARALARL
ncbi:MAG: aspartate aminotransferase family protein [Candidatus Omnitrophota bacterium]|jgi:predicted acetylornithine/succinylornithine family transaminase